MRHKVKHDRQVLHLPVEGAAAGAGEALAVAVPAAGVGILAVGAVTTAAVAQSAALACIHRQDAPLLSVKAKCN